MSNTPTCCSCGRAVCGMIQADGKYICAECVQKALAAANAKIAELERIDAAVDEWQKRPYQIRLACEDRETFIAKLKGLLEPFHEIFVDKDAKIAELEETNRNNVACYQMQVEEQEKKIAELEAENERLKKEDFTQLTEWRTKVLPLKNCEIAAGNAKIAELEAKLKKCENLLETYRAFAQFIKSLFPNDKRIDAAFADQPAEGKEGETR